MEFDLATVGPVAAVFALLTIAVFAFIRPRRAAPRTIEEPPAPDVTTQQQAAAVADARAADLEEAIVTEPLADVANDAAKRWRH